VWVWEARDPSCVVPCRYALFAAAREAVYNPLCFEARYVAKEIIDVFGYRAGKGGTSLILALATVMLPPDTLSPSVLSVLAVGATAVWCWSIMQLRWFAFRPPYLVRGANKNKDDSRK